MTEKTAKPMVTEFQHEEGELLPARGTGIDGAAPVLVDGGIPDDGLVERTKYDALSRDFANLAAQARADVAAREDLEKKFRQVHQAYELARDRARVAEEAARLADERRVKDGAANSNTMDALEKLSAQYAQHKQYWQEDTERLRALLRHERVKKEELRTEYEKSQLKVMASSAKADLNDAAATKLAALPSVLDVLKDFTVWLDDRDEYQRPSSDGDFSSYEDLIREFLTRNEGPSAEASMEADYRADLERKCQEMQAALGSLNARLSEAYPGLEMTGDYQFVADQAVRMATINSQAVNELADFANFIKAEFPNAPLGQGVGVLGVAEGMLRMVKAGIEVIVPEIWNHFVHPFMHNAMRTGLIPSTVGPLAAPAAPPAQQRHEH